MLTRIKGQFLSQMITRETDYGIRCVIHLASTRDELTNVEKISTKQKIPKAFTAKILQKLVKANIVKSTKGIGGGFALAKDPSNISLFEIVSALQSPMEANICVIDRSQCERNSYCSVHPVWVELQETLKEKLSSYTIQILLEKEKKYC